MRFGSGSASRSAIVVLPVAAAFVAAALRFSSSSALPAETRTHDWRFAGYRGTVGGPAANGSVNWEQQQLLWGGGELGPGLYVTCSRGGAWLYGAAQAQHVGSDKVALWSVDYDAAASWVEPTPVGNSFQYEKCPKTLLEPPNDVLINAAECKQTRVGDLPSQYKVNPHHTVHVRLRKLKETDVDSAFELADRAVEEGDNDDSPQTATSSVLPIVPVAADGQCFYSAVAFHVKLTSAQRAEIWRQVHRDLSLWRSPFGESPEEKRKVHEVRREIAGWIMREVQPSNKTLSPEGQRFMRRWKVLHATGDDGASAQTKTTSEMSPARLARAIADTRSCPPTAWGDPQLLWPVVKALYRRQIVVLYQGPGKQEGQTGEAFGAREGDFSPEHLPIEVAFDTTRRHYDACYWRGPFRSE